MVAHSLRGAFFGPAQALHGATFVVDVAFMAETLDANGVVVDIGKANEAIKAVLAPLNYCNWTMCRRSRTPIPRRNFSPITSSSKLRAWRGRARLAVRGVNS